MAGTAGFWDSGQDQLKRGYRSSPSTMSSLPGPSWVSLPKLPINDCKPPAVPELYLYTHGTNDSECVLFSNELAVEREEGKEEGRKEGEKEEREGEREGSREKRASKLGTNMETHIASKERSNQAES